jgi:hypothetical protein
VGITLYIIEPYFPPGGNMAADSSESGKIVAHLTIKRRHRNRRKTFLIQIRNYLKSVGIRHAEIQISDGPPVKKDNMMIFKLNSSLEPILLM